MQKERKAVMVTFGVGSVDPVNESQRAGRSAGPESEFNELIECQAVADDLG